MLYSASCCAIVFCEQLSSNLSLPEHDGLRQIPQASGIPEACLCCKYEVGACSLCNDCAQRYGLSQAFCAHTARAWVPLRYGEGSGLSGHVRLGDEDWEKMVSCDEAGIRLDASGEGRGMEKGKKASLMHNIRGIMHAYPEREEMILKGHVIS